MTGDGDFLGEDFADEMEDLELRAGDEAAELSESTSFLFTVSLNGVLPDDLCKLKLAKIEAFSVTLWLHNN